MDSFPRFGQVSKMSNKLKIRDNMDGVLENSGFYRKHVANEQDSIYRAISDAVFDTQHYKYLVKQAHDVFVNSSEGKTFLQQIDKSIATGSKEHQKLKIMAQIFKRTIELVYTSGPVIEIRKFHAKEISPWLDSDGVLRQENYQLKNKINSNKNKKTNSKYVMQAAASKEFEASNIIEEGKDPYQNSSGESLTNSPIKSTCEENRGRSRRKHREAILLCHSAPQQYDPVYKSDTIANAGFVQSILYEMLYKQVFKMSDAVDAANYMLNAEIDPLVGKPDVYDKEFEGTAMQALDNNLIPFPYKVAKALDPDHYRNIEYDVWTCEKRGSSASRSNSASRNKSRKSNSPSTKTPQTIGNLKHGTPCVVRSSPYPDIYGYVQGLTNDNRQVEVYAPLFDYSIFVARKCILPIQSLPQELSALRKSPTSQGRSNRRYQNEPIVTRTFYPSNTGPQLGNSSNMTYSYYDEGYYGSPNKSVETKDFEYSSREESDLNSSPEVVTSSNRMDSNQYTHQHTNNRNRRHYGPEYPCMEYPCALCYSTFSNIQIPNNNVVVNLSTNINTHQPSLAPSMPARAPSYQQYPEDSENRNDAYIKDIQSRNNFVLMNRDPQWLNKFDFGVPPPLPSQPVIRNQGETILDERQGRHPANNETSMFSPYRPRDTNNNDGVCWKGKSANDSLVYNAAQNQGPTVANPYSHLTPSRPYRGALLTTEEDVNKTSASPSNVFMGNIVYPTNLLVDIPHSPGYPVTPIHERKVENTAAKDTAPANFEAEQNRQLSNTPIPPIYVPVPYSFFGSMLNSVGSNDPNLMVEAATLKLAQTERAVSQLDNLKIDHNRICPSTPLATPSFPATNLQGGQVQVFQFPEIAHHNLPMNALENSIPLQHHPSVIDPNIERAAQDYSNQTRAVFNYPPLAQ